MVEKCSRVGKTKITLLTVLIVSIMEKVAEYFRFHIDCIFLMPERKLCKGKVVKEPLQSR